MRRLLYTDMAKEQNYEVSKRRLDPFGAREQAIAMVRNEAEAPTGRNTSELEYHAEDRGGHYRVTVREKRGPTGRTSDRAGETRDHGTRGTARAHRRSTKRARKATEPTADLDITPDGPLSIPGAGAGPDATPDLRSVLDSLYTVAELRAEASSYGVHLADDPNKRQIAERLIRTAPRRANRLAGR